MRIHVLVCAVTLGASLSARAAVKEGQPAIEFDQRTIDGTALKLSQLRGKVVLLDFWASWCEPCKEELPLLAEMAPRLRQRGIEIVAVNIDQNKDRAVEFLKSHGLQLKVVLDADQAIVKKYEPPKMPSSFAIDRNGVVRSINAGFTRGDQAKLEAQLTTLSGR